MDNVEPVFKEDIDKSFEERVRQIVKEEHLNKIEDINRIAALKSRVKEIEKRSNVSKGLSEDKHEHTDIEDECPTCKKGNLHVDDYDVTCKDCGKEYLLTPRIEPNKRKDYICTTCGHTMTKEETKMVKDDVCPMCKKGKTMLDINWDDINDIVNRVKSKRK